MLQLNVAIPSTGAQKVFEEHDEHKLRVFYEKRMGAEVEVDSLGDQWKGYVLRITGGNDKQGFPMKQGVLSNGMYCAYFFQENNYANASNYYCYLGLFFGGILVFDY